MRVDRVAQWLSAQGVSRYLVEVGGEMRLSGLSGRGDPWRIAIEQPDSSDRAVDAGHPPHRRRAWRPRVTTVIFLKLDGRRYSHSIDPRTGYPVTHDLVSVTVVHPSAMIADAWATALTVLGSRRRMAVAQEQGLAVYFIQRRGDGFSAEPHPAFGQYLEISAPAGPTENPAGFRRKSAWPYFLSVLLVIGLVMAAHGGGRHFGRSPIKGSCGGMGALGIDTACEICGGDPKRCDEETRDGEVAKAKPELYYSADK